MKLTERQADHLEILRDGELHHVVKGATSHSTFHGLVKKGLAERVVEPWTYHKTKYRVTAAGRAELKRFRNDPIFSTCGSPSAMCLAMGVREGGAETMK
jgi:DNA-binding PadR family transcriptional regulator